jgi:hypothetical protein
LFDQTIKDALCETKVPMRAYYLRIRAGRSHFGDFDPFDDYDLLLNASTLNLVDRGATRPLSCAEVWCYEH